MLIRNLQEYASKKIDNVVYAEILSREHGHELAEIVVELDGMRHGSNYKYSTIRARSFIYGEKRFQEIQMDRAIEQLEDYLKDKYGLQEIKRNSRTNSKEDLQR